MKIDEATASLSGREIVELSRQHTLFEWSAQADVDPIPVAGAKGCWFWTPEGKRFLDFNSQLMCVNIGHGDERVVRAIQRQAETLAYANPFMATEVARPARSQARRDRARRHRRVLLHQRRRRGERERDQDRASVHRTPQDPRVLSVVSRRHRRQHDADRRSAAVGRRARNAGRRPRAEPVSRDPARMGQRRRRRSRRSKRRSSSKARGRSPRFSSSRSPVRTASSFRPTAYLQGVRELCTKYGILMVADEVMSGLRSHGANGSPSITGASCPICSRWRKD